MTLRWSDVTMLGHYVGNIKCVFGQDSMVWCHFYHRTLLPNQSHYSTSLTWWCHHIGDDEWGDAPFQKVPSTQPTSTNLFALLWNRKWIITCEGKKIGQRGTCARGSCRKGYTMVWHYLCNNPLIYKLHFILMNKRGYKNKDITTMTASYLSMFLLFS